MTRHSQGIVDPFDFSSILEQEDGGTKLTFIIPTDVTGQSDDRSILKLKNQIQDARNRLVEGGMRGVAADELLEPVNALINDSSYWRLQSRSLVVFLADGFFQAVRVPIELPESLTIGERFNLLPLAPMIASDRELYILALAQNSVRLFNTSRNVIEELELENIPGSFDEVIGELPERALDVRVGSAGTVGTASHHGHDRSLERLNLEKYIQEVGKAVGERLGTARSRPLVLAAVEEYLPIFRETTTYPVVFDRAITGNPENAHADDLRSAAWQLADEADRALEATEQDDARTQVHAGKGAFDFTEIANAAEGGRVDTLYLSRAYAKGADEATREMANRALIGTLRNGGTLRTLAAAENDGLATFRY